MTVPSSAQPDASVARSTAIVVLGMHRSGTSALARVLNLLGVTLGNDLVEARADNPKGFWEHQRILETHDNLLEVLGTWFDDYAPLPQNWWEREEVQPFREQLIRIIESDFTGSPLWGFKDPRTCRLLPLWHQIFDELKCERKFVLMLRNPYEIARSLATRNGFSLNKSLLLSLIHLLDGEFASRSHPRVVVTYNELMEDWRSTVSKIGQTLEVRWLRSLDEVTPEVQEFLDPNLRHHVATGREKQSDANEDADAIIARWAQQMYDIFAGAAGDLSSPEKAALDDIRFELMAQMPRLELWREQRSFGRQLMVLEDWGKGLEKKRQTLEAENLHLRREIEHRDLMLEGFRTSHGQGPGAWWTFGQTKLKGLLQTLEDKEAEISQLNVALQEVRDSQAWFSEQYETVRKDREKREENIARLSEAVVAQQGRADELAAERDRLEILLSEHREQMEQLRDRIDQLQGRIEQLTTTLQARETSAQKLRVWIQQLELERIQKNDQIQKLEQEMRQLPEKL
jgi:hypothetical protein